MPYLQIDLPRPYPAATKTRFARDLATLYARAMQTQAHVPSIAFRELGAGNLMRFQSGEPHEVVVIMCDIRRGRDATLYEAFARELATLAAATFEIAFLQIVVEFTQHEAAEMFRYGAIAPEWSAEEAER